MGVRCPRLQGKQELQTYGTILAMHSFNDKVLSVWEIITVADSSAR